MGVVAMRIPAVRFLALAVATAALSLLPSVASAQRRPVRGVLRLAGEYGGERVVQFEYSDGSTPDVTAGGGLLLTGGAAADLWARGGHGLEGQLNLGLKYRTIPPATNQDATWLRFPVEALLFYRTPVGLRLGAGATVHLHNVLSSSGAVLNGRVEFENNPGLLLQAEYVRRNVAFDLRYTALEYGLASGGTGTVDASSVGVGVSLFLGQASRTPK
jgi:hypothetical protein